MKTLPALLLLFVAGACAQRAAPTPPPGPRELTVAAPDGITLATRVFGPDSAARTVIVVAGGPGLSHDYLEPLAHLASSGRRVVFYDARGTGRSGSPALVDGKPDPAHHRIADHVADLDAVRVAVGAVRADLVGHSFGGLVLETYAIAHPDAVASLTFVDSIPATAPTFAAGVAAFNTRLDSLVAQLIVARERPKSAHDGDCAGVIAILPVYYADPHFKPGPAFQTETCHKLGAATLASLDEHFDLRPALAALHLPTLVVMGDGDPFGTAWADELAHAVPGAREVILPRCGHFPWDECPAPFWSALDAFLAP